MEKAVPSKHRTTSRIDASSTTKPVIVAYNRRDLVGQWVVTQPPLTSRQAGGVRER